MSNRTILVWFRNDLRLHDNEVLVRALDNDNQIVPVYCFDPEAFGTTVWGTRKTGAVRASFIRQNVIALRESFRRFGGDLHVAHGDPKTVLPDLCREYGIDEVYHHREVAHEETAVSEEVEAALWKMQINLKHFIGHTLFHKEDLPFPIKDIPDSFAVFRRKAERESFVRPQLTSPTAIRFPEGGIRATEIPTLTELGFSAEEVAQAGHPEFSGGEPEALRLMHQFLADPGNAGKESRLSPYIASGALSPNTLYHAIVGSELFAADKKNMEFHVQKLLWRDYFRFMFKKHGNTFFQAAGFATAPPPVQEFEKDAFYKWAHGETDEPAINDGMRLLNETGFISGRLRLILATYLVHTLRVNWLWGAAWFEEKLIDYNPASNYGNWAHAAGVGSSVKDNKPLDINKILA